MEEEMGEEFDLAVPLPPSLLLLSLLPLPLSPRLPFLHSFSLLSPSPFSSTSCSPFIILTHPSSFPLLSTKCLPLHRHYLHHLLSFPSSNQFLLIIPPLSIISSHLLLLLQSHLLSSLLLQLFFLSCNIFFHLHYYSFSSLLSSPAISSIFITPRLFFPLLQSLLSSSLLSSFPSLQSLLLSSLLLHVSLLPYDMSPEVAALSRGGEPFSRSSWECS